MEDGCCGDHSVCEVQSSMCAAGGPAAYLSRLERSTWHSNCCSAWCVGSTEDGHCVVLYMVQGAKGAVCRLALEQCGWIAAGATLAPVSAGVSLTSSDSAPLGPRASEMAACAAAQHAEMTLMQRSVWHTHGRVHTHTHWRIWVVCRHVERSGRPGSSTTASGHIGLRHRPVQRCNRAKAQG